MRHQVRLAAGYVLAAILGLAAIFGCRAFDPETVIVNHPPETYLTGAPVEEGSGQFHFHLFWHGADDDGKVERYVWALTDSTIQDEDTDDDEEDERFNPAVNILTLEIGNWTTRTDTIIDFQINQGSVTSRDMTFHIVAVDDRGDFDRTPARLYFLSNALGVPYLEFFGSDEQIAENRFADFDTIGYAKPFEFSWRGGTENIASFSEQLLAERDTLPPLDGLYGYKYRLPQDVQCNEVLEDCWNPLAFDIASNMELSYFGPDNHLAFANDASGSDVYHRRLFQGVHTLLVNTTDVAGVEVPVTDQALSFVINYDPDTVMLGLPKDFEEGTADLDQDPFYDDDRTYPFYEAYRPDGSIATESFVPGQRVPQRSVATFKAIGWDSAGDTRKRDLEGEEESEFNVAFQGKFNAVGRYLGSSSLFRFESEYSQLAPSVWDDPAVGVSSDTLSFVVGPFDYEITMRSSDEHGRRDGTPEVFDFQGNFAPEVQCIEIVPAETASGYPEDTCSAEIDTLYMSAVADLSFTHPSWTRLPTDPDEAEIVYINPRTASIIVGSEPSSGGYFEFESYRYEYDVLIYAEDHEQERLFIPRTGAGTTSYGDPSERLLSCQYQIASHADSLQNLVKDGNGIDILTQTNFRFGESLATTHDNNGVWRLQVEVYVPVLYLEEGETTFKLITLNTQALPMEYTMDDVDDAFDLAMLSQGLTTMTVIASDGTEADIRPDRCSYVYYTNMRVPENHGESCETPYEGMMDRLPYEFFNHDSEPYMRQFVLKAVTDDNEIYPPMPN